MKKVPEQKDVEDAISCIGINERDNTKRLDLSKNIKVKSKNDAGNKRKGLYKTELCMNWKVKGSCTYGKRCVYGM